MLARDGDQAIVAEIRERRYRREVIVDKLGHGGASTSLASELETGCELLRYGDVPEPDVTRQAVLERREVLAAHERRQIGSRLGGDAEAICADEIARHLLLDVGDPIERRDADLPAVRLVRRAYDGRHDGIAPAERELHRRLADGVCLFEVGLRRKMPRRALQIIGDRPMVLVAKP